MVNEILTIFLLSVIPAALSFFLDYCFGHPMGDNINTKAIFFRYSLFLAKKALPIKQQQQIVNSLAPVLNSDDTATRKQGIETLRLTIMTAGREYFKYQQALGMCKYCSNFWVSIVAALIIFLTIPLTYINPVFLLLIVPVISHTILRKL